MIRVSCCFTAFLALSAARLGAQTVEESDTGGLGVAAGDEQTRTLVTGGGASLGLLPLARHGFRLDYFFGDAPADDTRRHFLTGSYVLQQRDGKARPFLQIGAGLMRETTKAALPSPSGASNDFAAILGVGVTIDIGQALFIRPELRTYWYVGPAVAILPGLSAGWRF